MAAAIAKQGMVGLQREIRQSVSGISNWMRLGWVLENVFILHAQRVSRCDFLHERAGVVWRGIMPACLSRSIVRHGS